MLFPWKLSLYPHVVYLGKTINNIPPMNIILAFLLSTAVLCHDFYITQPWAETKWKAGDTVKITWKLYPEVGPEASGINLDLMDGEDLSANFLLNIANKLHPSCTHFEWTIPRTVNSGDGLFVRITGLGEVPNYRFSHRFTIVGGEDSARTMSVIPPVAPTVDVNGLVRDLPPVSKPTGIPPPVSLIDPNVQVVTETVSVLPTNVVNRDRLNSSDAKSMLPSAILLMVASLIFVFC